LEAPVGEPAGFSSHYRLGLGACRICRNGRNYDSSAKKIGTSKSAVKKAVKKVGNSRKKVEKRLGR
jgi:hypothetical protein